MKKLYLAGLGLVAVGVVVYFAVADKTAVAKDGAPAPAAEAATEAAPAAATVSDMVVNVDGVKLTTQELERRISGMMQSQRMGQVPPQFMEQFRQQIAPRVIDGFVTQRLLIKAADAEGFKAEQAEIDKVLDNLAKTVPAGMTLDQALVQHGMTREKLTDDIQQELKVKQLLDKKQAAIPSASDADVEAFYKKNVDQFSTKESAHSRHILVKVAETASEETRTAGKTKIDGIHKQLVDGADFAKLAGEHSDCPSGQKGGDLGTFGRGQMVKPFEDAAFSQKVKEIGPVIETKFGYHIVQVMERSDARTKPLEEVKEQIVEQIKNEILGTQMQTFLEEMKKDAKISYGKGWEQAAAPVNPLLGP